MEPSNVAREQEETLLRLFRCLPSEEKADYVHDLFFHLAEPLNNDVGPKWSTDELHEAVGEWLNELRPWHWSGQHQSALLDNPRCSIVWKTPARGLMK